MVSGKFLDLALSNETETKRVIAEAQRYVTSTGSVSDEIGRRLDAYIAVGVQTALDDLLAEIRLLLLEGHGDS